MHGVLEGVGGLQLLVARDGQSAGRVGGVVSGTDLGTVLGSGNAKEVSEPRGVLAVGEEEKAEFEWGEKVGCWKVWS